MITIDDVKNWITREEKTLEYGEMHIIVTKHQGVISEVNTAIVRKNILEKKKNKGADKSN